MSGGAIGTMTASWTYYGQEDNSTVLYGTEVIMKIYDRPVCGYTLEKTDSTTPASNDFFLSGKSLLSAMRAIFAAVKSNETGRETVITENFE